MDEARIIPLHGGSLTGAVDRARRVASRRSAWPSPGPGRTADADILPWTAPADAEAPIETELVPEAGTEVAASPSWEAVAARGLEFLGRRLRGDYEVDEYGFDPDLAENAILPLLSPLYRRWFRVEVNGVENIPAEGGALLVANHAGGLWPMDAAMTAMAVHTEHPAGRFLRMLGADLVFRTPGLGNLARKGGTTLACAPDVERLLAAGELVGVWPEGFKGIGKPFRERYKLQRFGRGGFVHAALKSGVPIIPVSIIGSEEIHPVLGNARTVARTLNLPYFPLTPTFPWLGPLGLVPFPSKWYIEFGAPIHTEELGAEAAEDPLTVFEITDRVRETIQSTLYRLLVQRRSIWR